MQNNEWKFIYYNGMKQLVLDLLSRWKVNGTDEVQIILVNDQIFLM